ncbi:hypothetical protein J5X84_11585 [Streptosporangiaceae bacterium NEAU-GS5]|nr:hypothetical protein [Streptosporangiaceae bacterium NEAU-GS5]
MDHLVVLMLENRSFDHMLGFLPHPSERFDGLLRGGPHTNPGWGGGPAVAATPTAKTVLPLDGDHSHDAAMEQIANGNQGFVSAYERKGRGLAEPRFGGLLGPLIEWVVRTFRIGRGATVTGRGPLAMACQPPSNIPVLATLALEFAVCNRWFCSVPGETWPNRNYAHAASSDGETGIHPRFYTNPTIFELLERAGRDWRIYHDDVPQIWAFSNLWIPEERRRNWYGMEDFARHVAGGSLPAYTFIEPNHRPLPIAFSATESNSQHPGNSLVTDSEYDGYEPQDNDFTRGEALIARVYESLRANPELFSRTTLLITYDEHGGLYDHVPPATGMADPGTDTNWLGRLIKFLGYKKSAFFDFSITGPRVPAIIVSPLVPKGTVVDTMFEHASVPATLRAVFAPRERPLTARDAQANTFEKVLSLDAPRDDLPDLSAYTGPPAGPLQVTAATPDHVEDLEELSRKVLAELGGPVPALTAAPQRNAGDMALEAFRRSIVR